MSTRIDGPGRRSPAVGSPPDVRPTPSAPRAASPASNDGFEAQARPVDPAAVVPMTRNLSRPASGNDVRQLQEQLRAAGFDPGASDGKFGPKTEAALRAYQQSRGLKVDGVAGPQTYAALGLQLLQHGRSTTPTGGSSTTPAGRTSTPPSTTPADRAGRTTGPGSVDERHAIAQRIVKAGGSGTQADVDAVVAELEKLPLAQLQQLERQGTRVVACRDSVADYRTDLAGVQPRGWPPGKTWSDVPGAYTPERNEVVIATRGGSNGSRHVPVTGEGHGSANMVAHETGHALDRGGGYPSMNDADFQAAYRSDFGGLASYLQQPGEAGASEAYAESLALYLADRNKMRREHPALAAYWDTKFGA